MSQADVIRAFLEGGELQEATLRTDGKHLFSGGCLIAEKRGGRLHVVETAVGAADPRHRALLLDFVEWREQRAKVLRKLLSAKEMLVTAHRKGTQTRSSRLPPA
jgi:hypothetical protein